MKTLIKLLYILTPREQKLAIVLLTMILIMAFLDMLGVASIMPFIAILTNPDIIRNNILLNNIFEMTAIVGVQNDQQFIFILGIFVFLLLVFLKALNPSLHFVVFPNIILAIREPFLSQKN